MQVLLCGQDLPAGNYGALRRCGSMQRAHTKPEYWAAGRNYRTWLFVRAGTGEGARACRGVPWLCTAHRAVQRRHGERAAPGRAPLSPPLRCSAFFTASPLALSSR